MTVEAILLLVTGGLLLASAGLAGLGAMLRARAERRATTPLGPPGPTGPADTDPLLVALHGRGGVLDLGDPVARARASTPGDGSATLGDGAPTWVSRLDARPDGRAVSTSASRPAAVRSEDREPTLLTR